MNGKTSYKKTERKRIPMPDTFIIVAAIVLLMAILSWIIPAGSYDYEQVEINGKIRSIAIDGTFHYLAKAETNPTGFLEFFKALYQGCVDAADIIFVIFCCSGTFGILVKTGAFHAGIGTLLRKMGNKEVILVPILMSVFALGGSVFGMLSEFYGFIPMMVGLGVAMGYDAMYGFAIIALGEYIGFMGATLNPYSVGIAQSIAEVSLYSGTTYRAICLVLFITVSCIYVLRYGKKIKKNPALSIVYGEESIHAFNKSDLDKFKITMPNILIMLDVLVTLVVLMYGLLKLSWGYGDLCGLFLIMSMVAAAIAKWSPNKWVTEFINGVKVVLWGGILTGIAKGIVVVMTNAKIMDTVIYGLANALKHVPSALSAQAMLFTQTIFNFFIPSASGQAAATMPIMAPLADILGVSRQVAVLAFQFGDGLSNILWPTCGIVIICGISGISLEKWWKWFLPLCGIIYVMQMILIGIAVAIGY